MDLIDVRIRGKVAEWRQYRAEVSSVVVWLAQGPFKTGSIGERDVESVDLYRDAFHVRPRAIPAAVKLVNAIQDARIEKGKRTIFVRRLKGG